MLEHLGLGTEDDPIVLNEPDSSVDSGEVWGTSNPVWLDTEEEAEMDTKGSPMW